jgi:hypothetical protein
MMKRFFGERIEVKRGEMSPDPVSFKWRGEVHEVREILDVRVDIGFGSLPPRSRKWYTRRHRRYYVVRDSEGDGFEIYLDYGDRGKQTWWLVKRWEEKNGKSQVVDYPRSKG